MLMKDRQMVEPKPVLSCWLICCWYLTVKKVPAAVKPTMQGHTTTNNRPCSNVKSDLLQSRALSMPGRRGYTGLKTTKEAKKCSLLWTSVFTKRHVMQIHVCICCWSMKKLTSVVLTSRPNLYSLLQGQSVFAVAGVAGWQPRKGHS